MSASKIAFGPFKGPDVAGGAGASQAIAYAESTHVDTIDTNSTDLVTLPVSTTSVTNGIGGFIVSGVASQALQMRIDVLRGGIVSQSWVVSLREGPNTVGIPFAAIGIPAGDANWKLRARTDSGMVSVLEGYSRMWIEANNIVNGVAIADPNQTVHELVQDDLGVTDDTVVSVARQIPLQISVNEAVDHDMVIVSDGNSQGFVRQAVTSTTGTEDGWVDPTSFNQGTANLQAGNSGGDVRSAWWRFPLPYNLRYADIYQVRLDLMPDANSVGLKLRWRAVLAGDPPAPTTVAEFNALPRTAAYVDWNTDVTANVLKQVIDLSPLLQEIKDAGIDMTSVILIADDNGSPVDTFLLARSREHTVGPAPTLTLGYAQRYIGGYRDAYPGGY